MMRAMMDGRVALVGVSPGPRAPSVNSRKDSVRYRTDYR